MSRLTQKELRAVNYALSAVLAGELDGEPDGFSAEDIQAAKDKIETRIHWMADE
jgi:hypothetical protein